MTASESSRISDLEDLSVKLFMNETGIYPEEPIKDQDRDHIILVFLAKETKFPPKTLTQVDLKQEFYFPPHTSGSLNINEEAASSGVCIFLL